MFNFMRKKKTRVKKISIRNGLFSTDKTFNVKPINIENILSQSIQVVPKFSNGVAQDGMALDSCDGEVSCVNPYQAAYRSNIPDSQIGWYAGQGFIGYQLCAVFAQHWFVDKACEMPARDAIRNGWDITSNDGSEIDPAILDFMRARDKFYRLNKNLVQFVKMGRVFGIRIAMFKVRSTDPEYYTKPFNIDGVTPGSYQGIAQIDPYWIAPELDMQSSSDPASTSFYEPTWWNVNGVRVHKSHLVIFRGPEVADVLKPSYFYGGIPVPQKIYERVYAAERTANEAPIIAMTKRTTVLHVDVDNAIANQDAFERQIGWWARMRDNLGIKVVGTDEKIEQFDTSLTDLDAAIMTQYQLACSGANVPATKMLGTTPKGFNATGEYEEASYHEELESIQTHDLSPLIERHNAIMIRSDVCPKFDCKPFETTITWKSLDAMTAKELAEVNLIKAQTGAALSSAGAIDGMDERKRLIADPESGYSGMKSDEPQLPEEGDFVA